MSETLIGSKIKIDGEIEAQEPVVIQGAVRGKVSSSGGVYVENSAQVEADIEAQLVEIGGTLTGNVVAHERIELKESSRMIGDITSRGLHIISGAMFMGNITNPDMGGER